jgi:hypothetical protein
MSCVIVLLTRDSTEWRKRSSHAAQHAEDLDSAVLDRVDEQLEISLPTEELREQLLHLYFSRYVRDAAQQAQADVTLWQRGTRSLQSLLSGRRATADDISIDGLDVVCPRAMQLQFVCFAVDRAEKAAQRLQKFVCTLCMSARVPGSTGNACFKSAVEEPRAESEVLYMHTTAECCQQRCDQVIADSRGGVNEHNVMHADQLSEECCKGDGRLLRARACKADGFSSSSSLRHTKRHIDASRLPSHSPTQAQAAPNAQGSGPCILGQQLPLFGCLPVPSCCSAVAL